MGDAEHFSQAPGLKTIQTFPLDFIKPRGAKRIHNLASHQRLKHLRFSFYINGGVFPQALVFTKIAPGRAQPSIELSMEFP